MTGNPQPFSGLAARIVSALVAVGVLVGSGYLGGAKGWIISTGALVLLAQNEFTRIFFSQERVSERAVFWRSQFLFLLCLFFDPILRFHYWQGVP
jgi:hypothetical protein